MPERSTADMPRTWTIYVCRNDRCAPAVKPGLCNCVKPNRVGHRSGITTYESREAVEVVESGGSGEVPARREVPAEDAQRPGAECWDTRAKLEPWEQEHAAVIADELTYVGEVPAGLTERALHQIDGALDALERGVIGPVTAVPAIRGALAVLSGGTTYAEVTHPKFSADELLVLQRAMAGVFLEEDAPLRDGILRRLAKEMVKRRRDA